MTILDPERHRQYELEVHKEIWRSAFYDRHRLQKDLLNLYLKAAPAFDNRPLPKEYLARLIECVGDTYEAEFPPELPELDRDRHLKKISNPSETYRVFLQSFHGSLVAFTLAFPPEVRVPLAPEPPHVFYAPLPVFTPEDDFTPELKVAFDALKLPLTEARDEFERFGIFNSADFVPFAWYPFREWKPYFSEEDFAEREPIFGEPYERALWRERKREHEREQRRKKRDFERYDVGFWKDQKDFHEQAHKDTRETTRPWQETFHHSPYHLCAGALIPHVQVPFEIPAKRWFEGTWIVAAQGRGKTNLLRHLILHSHQDASVIVLDAKGDLRRSFSRMASIKDRLIIIEPDLQYPPALNPLDVGKNAVEFITYLFEALGTELSTNQTMLFRAVALLLEKIPNATLDDFRVLLQEPDAWKTKYEQYVRMLEPDDQSFWDKEFNTRTYNDRKPEVLLRLRLLMSNPYLRAMFRSPVNKFDFGTFMDEGKIALINNSYDPDKLGEEGCEFFGRTIIALVWAAARRRARLPDSKKRPVFFFIDEAHYVIARDPTIAKIIQQCRSQKVAMVFAHQEIQSIKHEDVRSALTNCAIKFANSTGEAHELAPRLHTTPEHIAAQKEGMFACYVLDKPPTTTLNVPLVPVRDDHVLLNEPYIPDHEFHALMLTMRHRYCTGMPDPEFPRSRADPFYDVEWECTISPKVAREGGTRTIHGLAIKIPPSTEHGSRFRLRGKGGMKPDGTFGDAYLTVHIGGHRGQFRIPDIKDDE